MVNQADIPVLGSPSTPVIVAAASSLYSAAARARPDSGTAGTLSGRDEGGPLGVPASAPRRPVALAGFPPTVLLAGLRAAPQEMSQQR